MTRISWVVYALTLSRSVNKSLLIKVLHWLTLCSLNAIINKTTNNQLIKGGII